MVILTIDIIERVVLIVSSNFSECMTSVFVYGKRARIIHGIGDVGSTRHDLHINNFPVSSSRLSYFIWEGSISSSRLGRKKSPVLFAPGFVPLLKYFPRSWETLHVLPHNKLFRHILPLICDRKAPV